jgi:hypothetical protein
MTHTGKAVAQLGLKQGITRGVAAASPAMLVFEAAHAVLDCARSRIDLVHARKELEALRSTEPILIKTLDIQHKELQLRLDVARAKMDGNQDVRAVLIDVVGITKEAFEATLSNILETRAADLPNIQEYERDEAKLMDAWNRTKRAMSAYDRYAISK